LLRAAAFNLGFGAVPQLSHLLRAACGGAQKEEKEFFGDTPSPGREARRLPAPSAGRKKPFVKKRWGGYGQARHGGHK